MVTGLAAFCSVLSCLSTNGSVSYRKATTSFTKQRAGWITWLLFTLVLHVWAVMIAYHVTGTEGGVFTAILPVFSWFRWALTMPDDLKAIQNAFTVSLFTWLISTSLLITARRLSHELRRRD